MVRSVYVLKVFGDSVCEAVPASPDLRSSLNDFSGLSWHIGFPPLLRFPRRPLCLHFCDPLQPLQASTSTCRDPSISLNVAAASSSCCALPEQFRPTRKLAKKKVLTIPNDLLLDILSTGRSVTSQPCDLFNKHNLKLLSHISSTYRGDKSGMALF